MTIKGRQISVRVVRETDAWQQRRAGGRSNKGNKADYVRRLIEREMAREREENLLEVFNQAAADVTKSDRAEREALPGAFAGHEKPVQAKTETKRKTSA